MTDANQQLRRLIDDYYSGRTSDDMIREIVRLFSELPSVPPDLVLDYRIFMACNQLPDTLPTAPDRLDQLIVETVDSCRTSKRRNRTVMFRWIAASCAAAALIALLISIGNNMIRPDQTSPVQSVEPPILSSKTPQAEPKPDNNPIPNIKMQPESDPKHQLIAQTANHPAHRTISHRKMHETSSTNHEITDPVEAAQRLDAVFEMLDNQLNISAKVQTEALNALDIANEKVSNIISTSLK